MNRIIINPLAEIGIINKNIYGHFSEHLGRCIYDGLFVGKDSSIPNINGIRTDAVEAMKRIKVPVLRWPGGCFADEYHWEDGIGPQENRTRMVNTNWGGVVEDNSFGTHEFLELCEQVGCEPYINANVGSGTVREMAEWVEYLNSEGDSTVVRKRWGNGRRDPWNVKYFGVGNESWGCGGNMRPEFYADTFRRYNTYCRNYGKNKLYRIACGPNSADYDWTDKVMQIAGRFMDALTLHYYTVCGDTWNNKGSATEFTQDDYYKTLYKALRMDELIRKHSQIMEHHDPEKRVGLIVDEWGTWFDVEKGTNPGFLYQQNTMRDAMVAAITLNIFNSHCDRVVMANIAQTVNVLQAIILTEGNQMVLTPTYHVFDLYKAHQDAHCVSCHTACEMTRDHVPMLHASASIKDGVMTITVANTSATESAEVEIDLGTFTASSATARILTGQMNDFNDFDHPETLMVQPFAVSAPEDGKQLLKLPACSVVEITVK